MNLGYSDLLTCSVDGYQGLVIGSYTVHWTPTGKILYDCSTWPENFKFGAPIATVVQELINKEIVQLIYKKRKWFKASCPIFRSSSDS